MAGDRVPEFTTQEVDGRALRVARWRATPAAANARPVLFFNGIGANIELMAPLADHLDGREIITFDMPGIGESPEPTWPYRLWMMARIANQIVDDFGHDEIDVMGVSWGGAMAQQYAMQYSSRVGQLVLCATTAGMVMVPGKLSALSKMVDPRRYVDPEFMLRNFQTLYGGDMKGAGGHASRISPPSMKGYFHQIFAAAGWTSAPFLPFMRTPTLIIMGDDDNIVRPINGTILKTLMPNATLEVIKGGGHLFLVNQADETAGLINAFLDQNLAPGEAKLGWFGL